MNCEVGDGVGVGEVAETAGEGWERDDGGGWFSPDAGGGL